MTTFETDGFLSAEISGFERTIAARYAKKFELAAETNRLTHRVMYSIKPHSEHVPDLMLAALLIRQASSFQGFLILLSKGLETQAQVLLRNLAEMMSLSMSYPKIVSRVKSLEAIVKDKQSRGEDVDEKTNEHWWHMKPCSVVPCCRRPVTLRADCGRCIMICLQMRQDLLSGRMFCVNICLHVVFRASRFLADAS